jgi:hypothetical protein
MKAVAVDHFWDDPGFQDQLISLLAHDFKSLTRCANVLDANDFKPVKGVAGGRARWIVAERALQFYQKHHEPIGPLLTSEVLDYANELGFGAGQRGELNQYLEAFQKIHPKAPDALIEKVVKYKTHRLMGLALQEMSELWGANKLDEEKWRQFTKQALAATSNGQTVPFLEQYTARIARRLSRRDRAPLTMIDPLDDLVRTVGAKQIGLVLAPYKRGKSMFLEWLAIAYARQRLSVLHITLEDPLDTVEDRLDSIVTNIPMKSLVDKPKTIKKKFARFCALVRARIEIYDGTREEMTIPKIEGVVNECRNRGFIPQVLLVDYDEKISTIHKYEQKRHEIDDVYRAFQELCARMNLIGWLAAQTQRNTRELKILTGDKVAEDIGKMRKVTCGISLGKGEWTNDSIYLYVAAHRNDRMDLGCEIVPDKKRGMIYDEIATRKAAAANTEDDTP